MNNRLSLLCIMMISGWKYLSSYDQPARSMEISRSTSGVYLPSCFEKVSEAKFFGENFFEFWSFQPFLINRRVLNSSIFDIFFCVEQKYIVKSRCFDHKLSFINWPHIFKIWDVGSFLTVFVSKPCKHAKLLGF